MPLTLSWVGTEEVENNSFLVLSSGERHFELALEVGDIFFVILAALFPHGTGQSPVPLGRLGYLKVHPPNPQIPLSRRPLRPPPKQGAAQ